MEEFEESNLLHLPRRFPGFLLALLPSHINASLLFLRRSGNRAEERHERVRQNYFMRRRGTRLPFFSPGKTDAAHLAAAYYSPR